MAVKVGKWPLPLCGYGRGVVQPRRARPDRRLLLRRGGARRPAVWMAHRLQTRFRQPWLPAYTLYLASWGALVLLSVVQYMLIGSFLPESAWEQTRRRRHGRCSPWRFGVTLYFLSSFMAQLTGGRLSRAYTIAYVVDLGRGGRRRLVGGALVWRSAAGGAGARRRRSSAFVLKLGIMYGWIAYAPAGAPAHRGSAGPPGSPPVRAAPAGRASSPSTWRCAT